MKRHPVVENILLSVIFISIIALVFAIIGCGPEEPTTPSAYKLVNVTYYRTDKGPNITEVHFSDRNVTCWTDVHNGGISCLPDSQVKR